MRVKRTLIFLAACSARSFDFTTPPDASTRVSCETTTTCTLECATPSSWTTAECKVVDRGECVDSYQSGTAYGCALECGRTTRVVASCEAAR